MDPRERYEDTHEAIQTVVDGRQASIWTALPGIVQSYDPVAITVEVQAAIVGAFTGPDGKKITAPIPVLPDVPVCFPKGGGYTLTFPIKPGDECLIVIASRCIDNWWAQGGMQAQGSLRMHDLSDGFAIVGPFSQKTKIANLSTTTTQLRSDDGLEYVEVDTPNKTVHVQSDSKVTVNATDEVDVTAPTVKVNATIAVNITSPLVTMTGDLEVAGAITSGRGTGVANTMHGDLTVTGSVTSGVGTGDLVTLQHHVHTNTSPPTPGT